MVVCFTKNVLFLSPVAALVALSGCKLPSTQTGKSKAEENKNCWIAPVNFNELDGYQEDSRHAHPVSSRFGPRRLGRHWGLDIASPAGTPLHCGISGHVKRSRDPENTNACGNSLTIDNGQLKFRYCHLQDFGPNEDETYLNAGDICGHTGGAPGEPGSGRSTGPHLHWEAYVASEIIDPQLFARYYESDRAGDVDGACMGKQNFLDPLEIYWKQKANGKYDFHFFSYNRDGADEDRTVQRVRVYVQTLELVAGQTPPEAEGTSPSLLEIDLEGDTDEAAEAQNTDDVLPDRPFLSLTDTANESLEQGEEPVFFDHLADGTTSNIAPSAAREFIARDVELPLGSWIRVDARGFGLSAETGLAAEIPIARGLGYTAVENNAESMGTTMYVRQRLPSEPNSESTQARSTYSLGLERALETDIGGILAYSDGCKKGDTGCLLNERNDSGYVSGLGHWRFDQNAEDSTSYFTPSGEGWIGLSYPFQEGARERTLSIRTLSPERVRELDSQPIPATTEFEEGQQVERFQKKVHFW